MARPAEALTYTIPEAADALRISPRSVWRQINNGTLPTIRIAGRTLIPRRELEAWVEANTTSGRPKTGEGSGDPATGRDGMEERPATGARPDALTSNATEPGSTRARVA